MPIGARMPSPAAVVPAALLEAAVALPRVTLWRQEGDEA
jgi:hypothetical protein